MIHPLAARGFERAVADYERGRPGYPAEAVAWLVRELRIDETTTVVDLGAGTGKLTRALVPLAGRVIGVEPVAAMRAALARAIPAAIVVDGTAESMPLVDASAGAVTVAQAFHWFDGERALREIRRVLVPGGSLGLVWNARDESVPWVAELEALLDATDPGAPRHKHMAWRAPFDSPSSPFGPLASATFRHDHVLDLDALVSRVASISYVASMPEDERARLLADVVGIASRHGLTPDRIVLPYRTDVYRCTARA